MQTALQTAGGALACGAPRRSARAFLCRPEPIVQIGPYRIDPPVLLAPMAAVSEMPYRVLCLDYGAGAAPTELVSAKSLCTHNARSRQYLTHDENREQPFWVQLFGGDPAAMAEGARAAVDAGARILDVNMGCPVPKVTKSMAGSALMTAPERAAAVVRAMRDAVGPDVPVTVKIRAGFTEDDINAVPFAEAMQDAGAAAIAIHPRSRALGYDGHADWDLIAALKRAVDVPVIGNGDVRTPDDVARMRAQTGCDAVMIGRGALGAPWVFAACATAMQGAPDRVPWGEARAAAIAAHMDAHMAFHTGLALARKSRRAMSDETRRAKAELGALRRFRQHLIWYSQGLPGAQAFRDAVLTEDDPARVRAAVLAAFAYSAPDTWQAAQHAEGINYKQAFG